MKEDKREIRVCSVQFCPVGDTVKATVDADAPVSLQERTAEETALLGLFCNLYSLAATLWVVALLKYTEMRMRTAKPPAHDTTQTITHSIQQFHSN